MKIILPILFAMCVVHGCSAQADRPIVIMQISDPQMGFITEGADMDYEIANLSAAVAAVNHLMPDAVVFTGDLVHDPENGEQWDKFLEISSRIDPAVKVFHIPGNHDASIGGGSVDMSPYEKHIGADRFAETVGCVAVVGLNTVLLKDEMLDSSKESEQFIWLGEALQNNRGFGAGLVFTHHPFFLGNIDDSDGYSVIAPDKRLKYFDLFRNAGVKAVFAGHLHSNAEASYDGIQMVTTSAVGRQLGSNVPGVRIIMVSDGEMTHKYYPLDEIPYNIDEIITTNNILTTNLKR